MVGGSSRVCVAGRLDGLGEIRELLGSHSLDEEVPVVQGLEVNLDDICVGLVETRVLIRNYAFWEKAEPWF